MPTTSIFSRYRRYYSSILRLGLPIMLGQLGVIITGFADTVMVGHYSTEALASASFVNNVFAFVMVMCMGFSYGITPIIGSLYARGETAEMGRTMRNALLLNMLFGLTALVAMMVLYAFLGDIGQPEELLPLIRPYFIVMLLSNVPVLFLNAMKQFTDGVTHTSLGMWILSLGNLLNIALNYILIYGKCGMPEMGLLGAGISTLIARVLMALGMMAVVLCSRRYKPFVAAFRSSRVSIAAMRRVWNTSIPIAIQMALETGSFTAASVMIGWLGKVPLAAYQIMVIFGMLGFMVYYSLGASVTIKISHYHGVGDMKRVRECCAAGYHIILLFVVIACSIFYLFGEPIIRLFTSDREVVAVAVSLILPMIMYQFGDATQVAYSNALRGLADVRPAMAIALTAYVIIGLPVCYVLGFPCGLGIVGIYISFSVSLLTAGLLFMHRFYSHFRRTPSAS